jgi:hypothetical protein
MVSGVTMGGRCVACDIDYSLSVTNGVAELWRINAPAKESLLHPLTESEIEVLNLKMQRYKALGPKWTSFMERRHGGDELWRYTRSHDGHTAIANVRSGIPISCFTVFGSL